MPSYKVLVGTQYAHGRLVVGETVVLNPNLGRSLVLGGFLEPIKEKPPTPATVERQMVKPKTVNVTVETKKKK